MTAKTPDSRRNDLARSPAGIAWDPSVQAAPMRSLLAVETAGRDPNRMEEKSNTEPARNIPLELRTKTKRAKLSRTCLQSSNQRTETSPA